MADLHLLDVTLSAHRRKNDPEYNAVLYTIL